MSYLRRKGMEVEVEVKNADTEGEHAKVEVYVIQDGEKIDLETFKKEKIQEKDYEIIQKSVLTVTRIFDNRLKEFVKNKIKGGGNPMHIQHYSYRIEFQARGAAHAHGVLWSDIEKMDEKYPGIKSAYTSMYVGRRLWDLAKNDNENTEIIAEGEENKENENKGKTENVRKETGAERLRKRKREVKALTEMVDTYVTCSLNTNTVGREAAAIAEETQKHNHTMSCRKYIHVACRFKFPRYPAPYTIITQKCAEKEIMEKAEKILEKVQGALQDKEVLQTVKDKIPLDMTCKRKTSLS